MLSKKRRSVIIQHNQRQQSRSLPPFLLQKVVSAFEKGSERKRKRRSWEKRKTKGGRNEEV